jgi:hypothetical protein
MKSTKTQTEFSKLVPAYRTLGDMVIWWERQSFAHDKGGSFDVDLYLRICKIKRTYETAKN